MEGQCDQAHLILVGQEMLDFKAWSEGKPKLTIKLEKCFQNQASNICLIKSACMQLNIPLKRNSDSLKNMLLKGTMRAAHLLSFNIYYEFMRLAMKTGKHRMRVPHQITHFQIPRLRAPPK